MPADDAPNPPGVIAEPKQAPLSPREEELERRLREVEEKCRLRELQTERFVAAADVALTERLAKITEHEKYRGAMRQTVFGTVLALVVGGVASLVGAAYVGWLAHRYEQQSASSSLNHDYQIKRYDQQVGALTNFADIFPTSLNAAYRMRLGWCWLREHREDRASATHPNGMAYDEYVREWNLIRDEYLTQTLAITVCALVEAQFDDTAEVSARSLAAQLRGIVQALLDATASDDVEARHDEANVMYTRVIDAMGAELRAKAELLEKQR